ncbi:MAG: two-component system response regulator FixJ, partial [Pirellulaceae bacterium]
MSSDVATIYIVDDDAAARRSMEMLARMKGTNAIVFESAEAFIGHGVFEPYSCLIADLRLTGMSGLDLQQVMLEMGIDMPVIIVTGHGEVPSAVRAMENGAVVFLEKPCQPSELWSHIERALESRMSSLNIRHVRALLKTRAQKLSDNERA